MIAFLSSPPTIGSVVAGQLFCILVIALAVLVLIRKIDEIMALLMRNATNNLESTKTALVETTVAARKETIVDLKAGLNKAADAIGQKVEELINGRPRQT